MFFFFFFSYLFFLIQSAKTGRGFVVLILDRTLILTFYKQFFFNLSLTCQLSGETTSRKIAFAVLKLKHNLVPGREVVPFGGMYLGIKSVPPTVVYFREKGKNYTLECYLLEVYSFSLNRSLTHLYLVNSDTSAFWTVHFPIKKMSGSLIIITMFYRNSCIQRKQGRP